MQEWVTDDLVEVIARAIHQIYLEACEARGDSSQNNGSMRRWEELPEPLRRSNIAQAAHICTVVETMDCVIIPESDALPKFAFTEADVELLAKLEHQQWVHERLATGFKYGPLRDDRHHPGLVDWEYLSASAKEINRSIIRQLPAILHHEGFQILELPGRDAK